MMVNGIEIVPKTFRLGLHTLRTTQTPTLGVQIQVCLTLGLQSCHSTPVVSAHHPLPRFQLWWLCVKVNTMMEVMRQIMQTLLPQMRSPYVLPPFLTMVQSLFTELLAATFQSLANAKVRNRFTLCTLIKSRKDHLVHSIHNLRLSDQSFQHGHLRTAPSCSCRQNRTKSLCISFVNHLIVVELVETQLR